MMRTTVYGLANCDSCRKARRWLDATGTPHAFVDLRAHGVETSRLTAWVECLGWETLLNRRSRSWRELPDTQRRELDATAALELMRAWPTLIKRPVLESSEHLLVGFSESRYRAAFGHE